MNNYVKCCLPSWLTSKNKLQTLNIKLPEKITQPISQPIYQSNRFKNLVNTVISLGSLTSFKNKLNNEIICKICNKEFNNEDKICDCLCKDELHPNSKETQLKIREKYIHNSNTIHEAIHIDKNPDKLVHLITDIYDIVEKSTLKNDLTPKTLKKIEENLINEICVHIEDYIKNEE